MKTTSPRPVVFLAVAALLASEMKVGVTILRYDYPASDDSLQMQTESCAREATRKNSQLTGRFSSMQIAGFCQDNVKWFVQVARRSPSDDRHDAMTFKQKKWISSLSSCNNLYRCLCPGGYCQRHNTRQPTALLSLGDSRGGGEHSSHLRSRRSASAVDVDQPEPTLRREYRQLADSERQAFHDALNRLKSDVIDGTSKYDLLVKFYSPKYAPGSHFGPAFLPFHREFLKQLEVALRTYDIDMAVPYWDSSLDEGLPNPADSILWTEDFLGNGNGPVTTGPFARWRPFNMINGSDRILRAVGHSQLGSLYRPKDFEDILQKQGYDDLTSCVDPLFELIQGAVGLWVGGHMKGISTSPDDPTFFLHHSFVDYLWEEFRLLKQTRVERETQYPSDRNACNSYHYANATMLPFKLRNIDGLSNRYTDVFYVYDSRPTCSSSQPLCESDYLFCDTARSRCLSQVRLGGNCSGFEWADICHKGKCIAGVCQPVPPSSLAATSVTEPTASSSDNAKEEGCDCHCNCTEKGLEEQRRREHLTTTETPTATNTGSQSTVDETVTNDQTDDQADWVWMTLTVLKGDLSNPVRSTVNAKVTADGVNYQGSSDGSLIQSSEYPNYVGLVVVQVRNPAKNGGTATTRLTVTDEQSSPCDPFCERDDGYGYAPCSNTVTLAVNRGQGDPVIYSSIMDRAVNMHWTGNRRKPDYLMFLCKEPAWSSSTVSSAKPPQGHCSFQRFDNFLLVGYADMARTGMSEDECKRWCESWTRERYGLCKSLMHWSDDGSCVLTAESRKTQPRLFVHSYSEPVTYFDYECE